MLRLLLLLPLSFSLFACGTSKKDPDREFSKNLSQCPENSLKIMTFNIHAMKDDRNADSQDRLVKFLENSDADVVFLQEVDQGTQRSLGRNQLSFLQTSTQYPYSYFAAALSLQGGEYGIGILSKYALDATETIKLDIAPEYREADYEPRVALHATVQAHGKPLHLVNTHLHYSGKARDAQWAVLRDKIQGFLADENPLILGGDFNAPQESLLIRDASTILSNTWKKDYDLAASPIDNIFTSKVGAPCFVSRSGKGISDHLAYTVETPL